jgi:hypothetical protein
MDELGAHLRFFIRKKISEDPLWQKPSIVFSGAKIHPTSVTKSWVFKVFEALHGAC